MTKQGIALQSASDALKNPYILDFLGMPDSRKSHESDLEAAIIENLKDSEQIFASKYMPYLPTEEGLRLEIERERRLIEAQAGTVPAKSEPGKMDRP